MNPNSTNATYESIHFADSNQRQKRKMNTLDRNVNEEMQEFSAARLPELYDDSCERFTPRPEECFDGTDLYSNNSHNKFLSSNASNASTVRSRFAYDQSRDEAAYARKSKMVVATRCQAITLFCYSIFVTVCAVVLSSVIIVLVYSTRSRQLALSCHSNASRAEYPAEAFRDHQSSTPEAYYDRNLPWNRFRLPTSILPTRYSIFIHAVPGEPLFYTSVNITVRVRLSTATVLVHSTLAIPRERVKIFSFSLRRTLAIQRQFFDYRTEYHVIMLTESLRANEKYQLRFDSIEGTVRQELTGLFRGSAPDADGSPSEYLVTQFQPSDARAVFPCFDEPSFKARFTIHIETREGLTVLSNMPPIGDSRASHKPGFRITTFEETPRMSTYLVALFIGNFDHRSQQTSKGETVSIYAPPPRIEETAYALQYGVQLREFFTQYFAVDDPIPKTDHLALSDHGAFAMENWGLITYVESVLLYNPAKSGLNRKFVVSLVTAHEVSHSWFGNIATLKWWNDLWLNEGFASLFMYIAMNETNPEWRVFDIQRANHAFKVMRADSLVSTHPVTSEVRSAADAKQAFDGISYDKGMRILEMLMHVATPTNFRRALRKWVQDFKYSSASMNDLWKSFDKAFYMPYNASSLMDKWVTAPGHPIVTVSRVKTGFSLSQTRFYADRAKMNSSSDDTLWIIPFYYQISGPYPGGYTASRPGPSQLAWLTTRSSPTILAAKFDLIVGNVDNIGFFRTNYDAQGWRAIISQLDHNHEVFSTRTRAMLIDDSFAIAGAGVIDYAVPFELCQKLLPRETAFVAWAAALSGLSHIGLVLSQTPLFGAYKNYIREMITPHIDRLDFRVLSNGDLIELTRREQILMLGAEVEHPKAIEFVQQNFDSWKKFRTDLPREYKGIILRSAMRLGSESDWRFVWNELRKSNSLSERDVYLSALCQTRIPWLISSLLETALLKPRTGAPEVLRSAELRTMFGTLRSSPVGRLVTFHFFATKWPQIRQSLENYPAQLRAFLNVFNTISDTERFGRIKSILSVHPPPPVVSRVVTEVNESIQSNIAWMSNYYSQISGILSKFDPSFSPTQLAQS